MEEYPAWGIASLLTRKVEIRNGDMREVHVNLKLYSTGVRRDQTARVASRTISKEIDVVDEVADFPQGLMRAH